MGVPCLIHVAEPIAFLKPLVCHNERGGEVLAHAEGHFHGK